MFADLIISIEIVENLLKVCGKLLLAYTKTVVFNIMNKL